MVGFVFTLLVSACRSAGRHKACPYTGVWLCCLNEGWLPPLRVGCGCCCPVGATLAVARLMDITPLLSHLPRQSGNHRPPPLPYAEGDLQKCAVCSVRADDRGRASLRVQCTLDLCPLLGRGWIATALVARRVFCLCRLAGRRGRRRRGGSACMLRAGEPRPYKCNCFVRAFSYISW